jgi:hypothetical protein
MAHNTLKKRGGAFVGALILTARTLSVSLSHFVAACSSIAQRGIFLDAVLLSDGRLHSPFCSRYTLIWAAPVRGCGRLGVLSANASTDAAPLLPGGSRQPPYFRLKRRQPWAGDVCCFILTVDLCRGSAICR